MRRETTGRRPGTSGRSRNWRVQFWGLGCSWRCACAYANTDSKSLEEVELVLLLLLLLLLSGFGFWNRTKKKF